MVPAGQPIKLTGPAYEKDWDLVYIPPQTQLTWFSVGDDGNSLTWHWGSHTYEYEWDEVEQAYVRIPWREDEDGNRRTLYRQFFANPDGSLHCNTYHSTGSPGCPPARCTVR